MSEPQEWDDLEEFLAERLIPLPAPADARWSDCMQAIDKYARQQVEAAHKADAELLEDLARDMKEDGSREQRALMKGAIAAYKSGAAAIRALP